MFMPTEESLVKEVDAACDAYELQGWTTDVVNKMVDLGLTHKMFIPLYAITQGLVQKLSTNQAEQIKPLLLTFEDYLLSEVEADTELQGYGFFLMSIIEHHLAAVHDHTNPDKSEERFILALLAIKHLRDLCTYSRNHSDVSANAYKAYNLAKLMPFIKQEYQLPLDTLINNKLAPFPLDEQLSYSTKAGRLASDPTQYVNSATPTANLAKAISDLLPTTTQATQEREFTYGCT